MGASAASAGECVPGVDERDSLRLLLERAVPPPPAPVAPSGATLARLHGFDVLDRPLVAGLGGLPGELVPAASTVALSTAQIGSELVVLLLDADPRRPVIVGVVGASFPQGNQRAAAGIPVEVDGQRLVIRADKEIVLECGDASITLQRSGRVVIRGRDVLSQSAGLQRIKGAAVDIN